MCPVCCWEDDLLGDTDTKSPANHGTYLSEAQANYILFAIADPKRKRFARIPNEDELLDPQWKPFPRALEVVEKARQAEQSGGESAASGTDSSRS
jgi:hypothetical protein